jgi:hypothetical protein
MTQLMSDVIGGSETARIEADRDLPHVAIYVPGPYYLGDDIGPSQYDGAEHRWPIFDVSGTALGWLYDTASGYVTAPSETMA